MHHCVGCGASECRWLSQDSRHVGNVRQHGQHIVPGHKHNRFVYFLIVFNKPGASSIYILWCYHWMFAFVLYKASRSLIEDWDLSLGTSGTKD